MGRSLRVAVHHLCWESGLGRPESQQDRGKDGRRALRGGHREGRAQPRGGRGLQVVLTTQGSPLKPQGWVGVLSTGPRWPQMSSK